MRCGVRGVVEVPLVDTNDRARTAYRSPIAHVQRRTTGDLVNHPGRRTGDQRPVGRNRVECGPLTCRKRLGGLWPTDRSPIAHVQRRTTGDSVHHALVANQCAVRWDACVVAAAAPEALRADEPICGLFPRHRFELYTYSLRHRAPKRWCAIDHARVDAGVNEVRQGSTEVDDVPWLEVRRVGDGLPGG